MKYKGPKVVKDKKVFLIEGALFLLASVSAVVGGFGLDKLAKAGKVFLPKNSLQDFLVSFLIITFLVLLFILLKNKKLSKFKEIIYKGFFIITVFWGGMTLLNLFLPVFVAILIMGILIALWLKYPAIWVHDMLMVLGLAGVSSFLGLSFSPAVIIALLLIFSIYDFVIEKKVILGFIIPKDVKADGNFMILGGGDVVLPSLLAVSVVPVGFLKSIIIVLFSLAGVFFSYWIFTKEKEPIPALPPIALFSIIGYLITLLF